MQIYVKIL